MFCDPDVRPMQDDCDSVARFVVATFRADAARAGAAENVGALVGELRQRSPEFEALWREYDARAYGEGTKRLHLVKTGQLPPGTDAMALATHTMAVIQGMSTLARDGASRATLLRLVRTAGQCWPTGEGPSDGPSRTGPDMPRNGLAAAERAG